MGGDGDWHDFDGLLLDQAVGEGVRFIRIRVNEIERTGEQLGLTVQGQAAQGYDLLAVTTGVNTSTLRLFEKMGGIGNRMEVSNET